MLLGRVCLSNNNRALRNSERRMHLHWIAAGATRKDIVEIDLERI
jgi:hypothetical protein